MLYATIVQRLIYNVDPCYNHPRLCSNVSPDGKDTATSRLPNHVKVWVQAPVYICIIIGEMFAYVTDLEQAYNIPPQGLRAMVQAISLLVAAVWFAGAMGFSHLAHDPYLTVFYACLTAAMAITTVVFCWVFRKYDEHLYQDSGDEVPGRQHMFVYRFWKGKLSRAEPSTEKMRNNNYA